VDSNQLKITKIMDLKEEIRDYFYNKMSTIEEDIANVIAIAEKHQSLQLLQTGVIASCSNAYIGKEFVYTSRITNCKTIFKVARTDDRYGQTILISENKNRYFLSDVIPHN
jgi:hypothetical protein